MPIRAEFPADIMPSLGFYSLLRRQQMLWLVHSHLCVFVRTDLRACRMETHKRAQRLPCPHRIPYSYACKHTRWHILTRAALHRLAHEYLLPSTCLSSGLRAFTRLCFPAHACVAIVPIASVMILPRLPALRVLRVIPACLVCVDLLRLSRVSGLLGVPG